MSRKFRKKPVVIEAVQFTGYNVGEVMDFTGAHNFQLAEPDDRANDPEIAARVYDKLHSTWVGVKTGQWLIRGVHGEFYPCDGDVFAATYEPVSE